MVGLVDGILEAIGVMTILFILFAPPELMVFVTSWLRERVSGK